LPLKEQEQVVNQQILDYIKTNNPYICILTPCYGGMCNVKYMLSLIRTIQLLSHYGILYTIELTTNDSLITRARNNLIAKALYNNKHTHIMFIDSDIAWNPADIILLLLANKPIVGGIYPLKKYHFSNFTNSSHPLSNMTTFINKKNDNLSTKHLSDQSVISQNLLKYNANFLSNEVVVENNLVEVKTLPTGFMMIQRHTLITMIDHYQTLKYVDDTNCLLNGENDYAYSLFNSDIVDNHFYSEDWMFCHRWTLLNGHIFANINIILSHTGQEDYVGCISSTIQ